MQAPAGPAYPASRRSERLLDLLFPPRCAGCKRPGRWICPRCWRDVPWLPQGEIAPAKGPLDAVRSVARFEGIAREAVHALKYENRHAISPMMGTLMAERVADLELDLVAPLSLHPSRRRERGYDQAAMLARHVARTLNIRVEPNLVRRIRKTQQQALLTDPAERSANVRGAFRVTRPLARERVLLIDDVYTTGATMEEGARALKEAGAGAVFGLVFARVA